MALHLRIISDQERQLGARAALALEGRGLTIGRAPDNDWSLPDPQRYVSAHHARIHHRDGLYILEDVSTNGVYLNDDEQPVSGRGAHVLRHGDVIRLGEYRVLAQLDPPVQAPGPGVDRATVEVVRGIDPAAPNDIDASLNLDDLLEGDIAALLSPALTLRQPRLDEDGRPRAVADDSPAERRALAQQIARLARAAELAQARHAQAQPQAGDLAAGLAAFCKGAGIDPAALPGDAQNTLLHLAGLLCRETLLGLKDLERVRRDTAARLGLDLPDEDLARDSGETGPSLTRMAVEETLARVMAGHQGRRLDAVQWLRTTLAAAGAHERAMLQATQVALTRFVARLDPVELESRFQRRLDLPRQTADARCWSLFADFYRSLTDAEPGRLPHMYVEAFATAYQDARAPTP